MMRWLVRATQDEVVAQLDTVADALTDFLVPADNDTGWILANVAAHAWLPFLLDRPQLWIDDDTVESDPKWRLLRPGHAEVVWRATDGQTSDFTELRSWLAGTFPVTETALDEALVSSWSDLARVIGMIPEPRIGAAVIGTNDSPHWLRWLGHRFGGATLVRAGEWTYLKLNAAEHPEATDIVSGAGHVIYDQSVPSSVTFLLLDLDVAGYYLKVIHEVGLEVGIGLGTRYGGTEATGPVGPVARFARSNGGDENVAPEVYRRAGSPAELLEALGLPALAARLLEPLGDDLAGQAEQLEKLDRERANAELVAGREKWLSDRPGLKPRGRPALPAVQVPVPGSMWRSADLVLTGFWIGAGAIALIAGGLVAIAVGGVDSTILAIAGTGIFMLILGTFKWKYRDPSYVVIDPESGSVSRVH